jgi:hypothetical protein
MYCGETESLGLSLAPPILQGHMEQVQNCKDDIVERGTTSV